MSPNEPLPGEPLPLRWHRDLEPPRDGDELLSASVGPDGEAITLWIARTDIPAVTGVDRTAAGGFPDSHAPHPVSGRVRNGADLVVVPDLIHAHPLVQPLPGGRILLASVRAGWSPDTGPEANATVIGADGTIDRKTLGDGIADLLTTPSGQIWVGYFDEGVFGNYGWGGPGPEPIGATGLARFDSDLRHVWSHPGMSATGADTGPIDECYALNLDDERAWCLMIDRPGFAVDEIDDGHVHGRRAPAGPASALCTDGTRIALLSRRTDILTTGPVGDTDLPATAAHPLVLPDGSPLPGDAWLIGRGPHLHLLTDGSWYRLDLDDVPGA